MSQQVGVYNSAGQFVVITIDGDTGTLPPGFYDSPAQSAAANGGNNVAPTPAPVQFAAPVPVPSPAYDINGNEVTIKLLGGDYANLPAGYYTSPGMAAVARGVQQQNATAAPPTAQTVGALYSNPAPDNQAAIQAIFDSPPPASTYVAPTPPIALGFTPSANPPPPTPQQIVAQNYIANGYAPPSEAALDGIVNGTIAATATTPLTPAQQTDPTPIPAAVTTHNVAATSATTGGGASAATAGAGNGAGLFLLAAAAALLLFAN